MENKKLTVQEWIDIENIYENGVIKLKNHKYIKIIKIVPINFNLKSDLEKQSILNSYKIFLKTCNFDIQILIQSNKQDLKKNIKNIEDNIKKENLDFLNIIGNDYIKYISSINLLKSSASKDFFIIIGNDKNSEQDNEDIIIDELNEKFFKIKECLLRCGNTVKNINKKEEARSVLNSLYNGRRNLQ